MEFVSKTKAVKLKSHMNKYLVAGADRRSTRQSRNGVTLKALWQVEIVDLDRHIIRLKSCYNRYLTASGVPFLLGMTGRKIIQTKDAGAGDAAIEWRVIRDGFQVKLQSHHGTYLRANAGTPPWRNSVTHDIPIVGATRNYWIMWDVEAVEDWPEDAAVADCEPVRKNFPIADEIPSEENYYFRSVVTVRFWFFRWVSLRTPFFTMEKIRTVEMGRENAMDLFRHARAVRLKSVHGKYLTAVDDCESVTQDRDGSSNYSKWTVEFVQDSNNAIRLKSCNGTYLTASNQPFLLGATGKKVLQTLPPQPDSSVSWVPIRGNGAVKLRTRYGNLLRANGGLPPWRNSITHDVPHRRVTQNWVYWEVHVVEFSDSFASPRRNIQSPKSEIISRQQSSESLESLSPRGSDGRFIYYRVGNELGEVGDEFEEVCITFKGSDVNELTWRLEEELGTKGITVCTRSPLNGEFYPLRLQLPPNNATMHIIVIPSSSQEMDDSEDSDNESWRSCSMGIVNEYGRVSEYVYRSPANLGSDGMKPLH